MALFDAHPSKLIKKIIIGPTEFPVVVRDAFVKLLTDAGVDDASEKVVISFIPLR